MIAHVILIMNIHMYICIL